MDLLLEVVGEFSLPFDFGEDGGFAIFEFGEVGVAIRDRSELGFVEVVGALFAVTGNKGDGGTFGKEGEGIGDLSGLDAEFLCDEARDINHEMHQYIDRLTILMEEGFEKGEISPRLQHLFNGQTNITSDLTKQSWRYIAPLMNRF